MKPDYEAQRSPSSSFPNVRPEIDLNSVSEIYLKDKVRPETVTEVAPETSPYKPKRC